MLSIEPWNIFWTVINLLFLYFIFKKYLLQPVMNVIHQREEMVKGQFDSAKQNEEEALAMKADYEKRLQEAKTEASGIILAAKARAEEEHNKAVEQTRKETEHMLEKAKVDIAAEQERATNAAQREIAKLAMLAAKKIIETGEAHDADSTK